jgi:hypothetical protein
MGLLNLYLQRRSKQDEPDNLPFEDAPADVMPSHRGSGYHPTWERQMMPTPGAEAYAWKRLALMPFSTMAIGTGIEPRGHLRATSPGSLQAQTITLVGIATQSGSIRGQPLYDPNSGAFTGAVLGGRPINTPFSHRFAGGQLNMTRY